MKSFSTTYNPGKTSLFILFSLSLAHFFNDMFQSVVVASYPVMEEKLSLNISQIGLIILTYQICASVLQPVFGVFFDKHPSPWYLTIGTSSTLFGLLILSSTSFLPLNPFFLVLVAVSFIGFGSSIIHPEASRLTQAASGGQHGLAQSIFQIGGNFATAVGPLLALWIITPHEMSYFLVFVGIGFISLLTKSPLMKWNRERIAAVREHKKTAAPVHRLRLTKRQVYISLSILLVLVFSKYIYTAVLSNYYIFYLKEKFGLGTQGAQVYLFIYLFAAAVGTLAGGPIGDRFGRKYVIWFSILGTAPFSLMMPYASNVYWACVLSVIIGLVLSSAFSAILVYAQELLPTKVGLVSGFFFGFAFGIAGIAAAVFGHVANNYGFEVVYKICGFTPLLGVVAIFLPNVKTRRK
jgi:FSR family fosmidomycin resistance protein-like MFS transporter